MMEGQYYREVFRPRAVRSLIMVTEKGLEAKDREQLEKVCLFLKVAPANYQLVALESGLSAEVLISSKPSHIVFWGFLPADWMGSLPLNEAIDFSGIACLQTFSLQEMNKSKAQKKLVAAILRRDIGS